MEDNNINPINQNSGIKVNYLSRTFLWMFFGLLATALISYITYSTGAIFKFYESGSISIVALIELIVVVVFSFLFRKLSPNVVAILYFIYAILNGVTMSTIFVAFELSSILVVFGISAAVFGIFAFLGYKTSFDLSKVGNILLGILVAGIIASIVNIFLGNDMFALALDWIILIVFFGVTAYDIQKIKNYYEAGMYSDDKIHIYGAMEIYLDFINIFIRILSIFARRRD